MGRGWTRLVVLAGLGGLAVLEMASAAAWAQSAPVQSGSATASAPATQRADIFDTNADAKAQIATALQTASRDSQRVLLLLGGNWCSWCHRLHTLFKENRDVARMLLNEYQLVLVDVGRFDNNREVIAGYELDLKKTGLPYLVVLRADGNVLAKQETGSLEEGQAYDPQKVLAFLDQWKAEPRDAAVALEQGLSRAAAEHKSVLLHFGAPWCSWCRRLESFLGRPEIAGLLGRDFVDLKIDMERMGRAREIAARFCGKEKPGLPWIAVVDAEGKVVVTSDAPEGNIGYPTTVGEISYFMNMLRNGAQKLSAGDLQKIEGVLREAAAQIKPAATSQP